jgi:NADPH:quinone reductase-like Zn-dependent oxidoreductase
MQAIVQIGYGLPGALELRDVDVPRIGDADVLVKVHAASVNALDYHMARGTPYIVRFSGPTTPGKNIRGVDLSGQVEAVGKNVVDLKAGDEVFGGGNGSFAEYASAARERLTPKPAALTHGQAAALYVAGLTALQGLRDTARLQRGQSVLVNGAGGGVGTFAVQIAKWLGARVTGVTRTENIEMVRSIGADEVIDYRTDDFVSDKQYDVFFDIAGNRSFADCRRVVARKGTLVVIGGPPGRWLAPATRVFKAIALSPFVSQRLVPFLPKNRSADLVLLKELAEEGKIRAAIDREYLLGDVVEALSYAATGQARGKVIIRVR